MFNFSFTFFFNSSCYLLNKKCYPVICCCLSSLVCAFSVLSQVMYVQSLAFSQVSVWTAFTLWILVEFTQDLENLKVSGFLNHIAFYLFPTPFSCLLFPISVPEIFPTYLPTGTLHSLLLCRWFSPFPEGLVLANFQAKESLLLPI